MFPSNQSSQRTLASAPNSTTSSSFLTIENERQEEATGHSICSEARAQHPAEICIRVFTHLNINSQKLAAGMSLCGRNIGFDTNP